jgi:hypothetical protein
MNNYTCYICESCIICNQPSAPTYLRPRSDSYFKINTPLPPVPDPPHYGRPRSGSFFKVIPPFPEAPHYARPRSGSFFKI